MEVGRKYHIYFALTLNAPIATKVVCSSMSNSVDSDQTAPVLGPRCLLLYLIRQ